MSCRRKQTTRRFDSSEMFTLAEVMLASPTEPMPAADAAKRKADTEYHLNQLATAQSPTVLDWRVVSMVGNVFKILLDRGIVEDNDGLLDEAFQALKDAAGRNIAKGANIRLSGPGLIAVRAMVREWGELLDQAPHRTMLQVFREVHRRLMDIDAGMRRPEDYVAQIDGLAQK